ncbi:arrestin domain-containing protein 3-like [Acanthochromis polyacanthus]|uniref:arrestin domain-containing protein 3-like n=1 Tax=Acanthochromis polyacanthus TaxID=80966 RepID=UPI002234ACE7|nr:arrestin domain-containing protein 3-like [Acanthochromis polyacanthus]
MNEENKAVMGGGGAAVIFLFHIGHTRRRWRSGLRCFRCFASPFVRNFISKLRIMSSTVKKLEVTYNPINKSNTFTCGDTVCGQVTLEVAKDCQIESLSIKFKGKAEVLWTERHGQTTVVYHSKDKYFSVKHYFIGGKTPEGDEQTLLPNQNFNTYSNVVAPGSHVYPFTFQIPHQDMPSSFKGSCGKVVYLLEATLSRSMRINKKDSTKINFVSNVDWNNVPGLMTPQHESKDKKMKFFNSGTVAMDVNIEKSGFLQGEGLKIVALIQNNSSREIKPKYCVYRKHSFFARGKRRLDTKDLFKEVGDPIPPSSNENVTRVITIPHDVEPSILNCSILKVEYRLRVYLDVKYASDPEIKFPIVLLPAYQGSAAAAPPVAAGFGFEPFGNPNPPVWGTGAPQAPPPGAAQYSDPPPPYGAYGLYPPLTDFGNKF